MKYFNLPTIDGIEIKFRLMSAEESDRYLYALKQEDNPYTEEFIFNTITDNQYLDSDLSAGIIPLVLYTSFRLSGTILKKEDLANVIDNAREIISKSTYFRIYAKIIATQPNYSIDELKTKTLNEIIELMVLAEIIDGKPLIDTDKIREEVKLEEVSNKNPLAKTGVKGLTQEMLDSLMIALQQEEEDY